MEEGKLELTWVGKDRRLLSHGDDRYEWVDPADWRVSEIRLLHDVDTVGDPDSGNLLIHGDAMHALDALIHIPELAARYEGKVKLVYIDPPFNTGQAFAHYEDNLEHSVWLTLLRDRLTQIQRLLAPDGSVWVHLDDVEAHRARCVLDEVFGAENFMATVIWEKTDSPRMDAAGFSVRHDSIHVYRQGSAFAANQMAAGKSNANRVDEEGRLYYLDPLRSRSPQGSTREARPNLYFPIIAPDGTEVRPKLPDGRDGAWRWGKPKVESDSELIEWVNGKRGWNPYTRIYEAADRSRPPETIWAHSEVGSTRTSANEIKGLTDGTSFSTPKPERLLERVIHIGSNPGDIVLDCFGGSGTTAAVAHKMGRRWVTVEMSGETVSTFLRPRLEIVVNGEDPGGITTVETPTGEGLPDGVKAGEAKAAAKALAAFQKAGALEEVDGLDEATVTAVVKALRAAEKTTSEVRWEGGGGFTHVEVGRSMFEEIDGTVVMADWAVGGELTEAVAAQLEFELAPEGPLAGRKGRKRLAVVDGMVTAPVVEHLVGLIGDDETLLVVGRALAPGVEDRVRELRSGSRARKIPRDLATVGRLPSRLVRLKPRKAEVS